MAYKSREKQHSSKSTYFAVGVFVSVLVGVGGFFAWQAAQSDGVKQRPLSTSTEAGIVAVLGTDTSSSTPQSSSVEPQDQPLAISEPEYSGLPYELTLPDGWSEVGSDTKSDPCGGQAEWLTATYKKGQETLIVYENGHPNGCDGEGIADMYLDFNYTSDGAALMVDTTIIEQCTKEENPLCPKGDGRVSVYIGNVNEEDGYSVNSVNGRTYFFSLTDTGIDPDFTAQVKSLAAIVEGIQFK